TDKTKAYSPGPPSIEWLVGRIRSALVKQSGLRWLIAYDSGSFGRFAPMDSPPAHAYPPTEGGGTEALQLCWNGFAEGRQFASQLSRMVAEASQRAGLPTIPIPPYQDAVRGGENAPAARLDSPNLVR
ncbi:MAG TPA: hypothetical protein VF784_12800, partial [Anaerolineales bacterium]